MLNLLFICSQARLRSPTAEAVFSTYPGVDAACAGLNNDADVPVDSELLEWADYILVMEETHRAKLSRKFKPYLRGKRVIVLGIPDEFDFMQPDLVRLLKTKVSKVVPV